MRWNDIDLINPKTNNNQNYPDQNLIDRTTDVYLATTLSNLNQTEYLETIEKLKISPFEYLSLETSSNTINTFDQFTFKYKNQFISIGGFLVNKDSTNNEKNKTINKQIKSWSKDYESAQRGKIKDITNKVEVLKDLELKTLPTILIIINAILIIILSFLCFPTEKLKTYDFIIKLISLKKLMMFSLIFNAITFITQIALKIYINSKEKEKNEMAKQIEVLDKKLDKKLNKFVNILKKHYKNASKKIKNNKYKPLLLNNLKKYQKDLNLNHIIEDYLDNLSNVKKQYQHRKTFTITLLIVNILILLTLIFFIIKLFLKF